MSVESALEYYHQIATNGSFNPCHQKLRWDIDNGFDNQTRKLIGFSDSTIAARSKLLPKSLFNHYFYIPYSRNEHVISFQLGYCPENVIGGF